MDTWLNDYDKDQQTDFLNFLSSSLSSYCKLDRRHVVRLVCSPHLLTEVQLTPPEIINRNAKNVLVIKNNYQIITLTGVVALPSRRPDPCPGDEAAEEEEWRSVDPELVEYGNRCKPWAYILPVTWRRIRHEDLVMWEHGRRLGADQ